MIWNDTFSQFYTSQPRRARKRPPEAAYLPVKLNILLGLSKFYFISTTSRSRWFFLMCRFIWPFWLKVASQKSHGCLIFLCLLEICLFKVGAILKDLLQYSHLKGFNFKCTPSTCLFNFEGFGKECPHSSQIWCFLLTLASSLNSESENRLGKKIMQTFE